MYTILEQPPAPSSEVNATILRICHLEHLRNSEGLLRYVGVSHLQTHRLGRHKNYLYEVESGAMPFVGLRNECLNHYFSPATDLRSPNTQQLSKCDFFDPGSHMLPKLSRGIEDNREFTYKHSVNNAEDLFCKSKEHYYHSWHLQISVTSGSSNPSRHFTFTFIKRFSDVEVKKQQRSLAWKLPEWYSSIPSGVFVYHLAQTVVGFRTPQPNEPDTDSEDEYEVHPSQELRLWRWLDDPAQQQELPENAGFVIQSSGVAQVTDAMKLLNRSPIFRGQKQHHMINYLGSTQASVLKDESADWMKYIFQVEDKADLPGPGTVWIAGNGLYQCDLYRKDVVEIAGHDANATRQYHLRTWKVSMHIGGPSRSGKSIQNAIFPDSHPQGCSPKRHRTRAAALPQFESFRFSRKV